MRAKCSLDLAGLTNNAASVLWPCAHVMLWSLVKPARLHFARTARALRDATCERGVLSEFRAARTCASYWFDNMVPLFSFSARAIEFERRGP